MASLTAGICVCDLDRVPVSVIVQVSWQRTGSYVVRTWAAKYGGGRGVQRSTDGAPRGRHLCLCSCVVSVFLISSQLLLLFRVRGKGRAAQYGGRRTADGVLAAGICACYCSWQILKIFSCECRLFAMGTATADQRAVFV